MKKSRRPFLDHVYNPQGLAQNTRDLERRVQRIERAPVKHPIIILQEKKKPAVRVTRPTTSGGELFRSVFNTKLSNPASGGYETNTDLPEQSVSLVMGWITFYDAGGSLDDLAISGTDVTITEIDRFDFITGFQSPNTTGHTTDNYRVIFWRVEATGPAANIEQVNSYSIDVSTAVLVVGLEMSRSGVGLLTPDVESETTDHVDTAPSDSGVFPVGVGSSREDATVLVLHWFNLGYDTQPATSYTRGIDSLGGWAMGVQPTFEWTYVHEVGGNIDDEGFVAGCELVLVPPDAP